MKILIADDHSIVREGVKQILKSLPEVTHMDEASDGSEALLKINTGSYDLVILDISMPVLSGLDILQIIGNRDNKTPILILSSHSQEQYAIRAFKLGASGYVSKDSAFQELVTAVRKIASGRKYVSTEFAEKLLFSDNSKGTENLHDALSEREFQVMIMLAKGLTVIEIAEKIFITYKTVSTYRSRVMEKMGLHKNADLTLYALKNNLIE